MQEPSACPPLRIDRSPRAGATACVISALLLWGAPAGAAVYHVAQSSGSDQNDGSDAAPFATISRCATMTGPGDTCLVHAGVYRETVSPPRSGAEDAPILFQAADGECVTVSGTEPVTASFTQESPNLWSLPLDFAVEQLFSQGVMVWEAQWPNRAPGTMFDPPRAVAAPGTGVQTAAGQSVTYLVDPDIPPGDWTGATVFILPGARWQSDSRPVKAYDEATHTITLDTTTPWAEASTQPIPSNHYYLYGSKLALDAPDEWLWSEGKLYYESADDPGGHGLEYKRRAYAFDVGASYVEIVGFHVFGAAVRLTGDHDTVDSLSIEYSSHLRSFDAYYTEGDVNRIVGDDNTWKNSIIDKSGSAGLLIQGDRNWIENNIARDVVYQATNHAGFDMDDWTHPYQGNVLVYNTVERSGRAGIFQSGAQGGRVLFNKVSDWALLTNDMGGIYSWGTDGAGTEIAYNELASSTAFWSNGIYLDDRTKHFVVHHNFVHDSTFYGFNIKEENHYFNNTVENVGAPFQIDKDFQNGVWEHTNLSKVENNLTDGTLLVRVGVLPTIATDHGYFEAEVHATGDWQHVVIPFSTLYQPAWFTQVPLDLTSVQQIAFTPWTNGDFELDVDNVALEGPTPLLIDDFESSGTGNGLGGQAWGGGSGDGASSTSGTLSYAPGGATSSSHQYAQFTGTVVLGDDSWGLMEESVPDRDLSAYTGLSFDVRGQTKGLRVLATGGNSPEQDHNDSCAFSGTSVPACAVDRGAVITGITDGFTGAAPDLGAFESGKAPWVAGARRTSDAAACGKVPDVGEGLPPPVPNPWSDAGVPAPDGGAPLGPEPSGDGCRCLLAGSSPRRSLPPISTCLLGLLVLATRRRMRVPRSARDATAPSSTWRSTSAPRPR